MKCEQDHRFVKKRIAASLGFRSVDGALRTIQGYEAMNKIRIRWLAKVMLSSRSASSIKRLGSLRNSLTH
jgi:transposase-like protein